MARRLVLSAVAATLLSLGAAPSAGAAHRVRACVAIGRGRCLRVAPVGTPPLSDGAAARLVNRSSWEPRPDNRADNERVPSASDLAYFRAHSQMPYKGQVSGDFTGTTDEIIQWAAYKHGLDPELLRAVAAVESWWHMSTNGDNGDSFGLFQLRRPYHCCDFLAASDTAFNADYYAAIIRSFYDGRESWLNTVSGNGERYRAGDLWGSVGAWFSGRWHDAGAERYVAKVEQYLRQRIWRAPFFAG